MSRAVIVEDSELARFELEHLLRCHPDIEVVAQAGDIETALVVIAEHAPELIFLDIDLSGGTAFDLLARLQRVPQIIFTTAFDAFALQAFEYNTVDYLLKPIEPQRLAQALEKIRPCVVSPQAPLADNSPLYLRDGERNYLVRVNEIRLIEAIGNYSRLYFGRHSPMLYRALGAIEERLTANQFFRASRKYLVNLNFVERIEPASNGGLLLVLRGGEEVEVSRRQAVRLRELMSL